MKPGQTFISCDNRLSLDRVDLAIPYGIQRLWRAWKTGHRNREARPARRVAMYTQAMRRCLASLLVALFSFALISPAVFASNAEGSLPACCRRAGKHHCSMSSEVGSTSGPALRAARCASFPGAQPAPVNPSSTFFLSSIQTTLVSLASSDVQGPVDQVFSSIHDPATPKRGPPVTI